MRIVSLIASATEIVSALGMGEFLVGRSHECDFPPCVASLPVCTSPKFVVSGNSQEIDSLVKQTLRDAVSVYDVHEQVLEQLQPTHVITQSQCEVCAVSLKDVELAMSQRLTCRPRIVSLQPNSLADLWADIQNVADALAVSKRGRELIARLQARMRSLAGRVPADSSQATVACIEWLEPLMAGGNWVPELVEMVGGVNLFGEAGRHSPGMSWEELNAKDPEFILVMPCGFDLERTESEMHWLVSRAEWPGLQAVRKEQVFVTDGNQYFNRPGPRVVETLQILAEILYPQHFPPALEGSGWKRYQ